MFRLQQQVSIVCIFLFRAFFDVSRNYKYLSFPLIDFDGILMKSYLRSNIYAVKKLASSYLLCIGSQSLKKLAPSDGEIFGDEIGGESNHGTKKNKKTGQWLIANYITNFDIDIIISNIIANYERKSFIWHLTESCSFIRLVVTSIWNWPLTFFIARHKIII